MTEEEFAQLSSDEKFAYLFSAFEATQLTMAKLDAAIRTLRQQMAKSRDGSDD